MRGSEGEVIIPGSDALHVPRPQGRRAWIDWYAQRAAARARLLRHPAGAELAVLYGVDADTIREQVARWDGPRLPDDVFTALFGTPTGAGLEPVA